MKKIILSSVMVWLASFGVNAQCTGVTFTVSTDTVKCDGDSVNIIANGQGAITTALGNDFNIGSAGTGWAVSPAGVFTNPCGNGPGGTTDPHMWMGNTTAAPRTLQTTQLDVQCGGQVCFDFRMAIQSQGSPCEGPDAANEGIYLECSLDGITWTTMNYFVPNTAGSLNSQTPGSGDYTGWANYCFTIPASHETDTTVFRWYQGGSSGNGFDHWGIDNVVISSFDCQAYHYDWSHIAGTPDTNDITIFTDTDTSYTVIFTDGIADTCIGTVFIYRDTTIDLNVVSTDLTSCVGVSDGAVELEAPLGTPAFAFDISGTATGSNSTGIFTGLPAGTYSGFVLDDLGCTGEVNFTISNGPVFPVNSTSSTEICFGNSDGEINITPNGGVSPYVYDITGPSASNNTVGDFDNLPPGIYFVTVTDDIGCISLDTILVDTGIVLAADYTGSSVLCFGDDNGTIDILPTNGIGPYTYTITGPSGTESNFSGDFDDLLGGAYLVTTKDGNGCLFTDTVMVVQPNEVIASFVPLPDTGVAPMSVDFLNNSAGASDYFWNFMDGDNSTLFEPNHVFGLGTYNVMLVASNGPCADTTYHIVYVIDESYINFPNVITPNGSGENDVFQVIDHEGISEFNCVIFNRWGTQLYSYSDINGNWDGTNKAGKLVVDGTYFYVVKAKGLDDKEHIIKGTVNVMK